MKLFRLCLLILLALLIPVRGAVAAAMLCPPMGFEGHTQSAAVDQHQASQAGEHEHVHEHTHDHHGGHHDQHQTSNAADKCNLCAAYCSLTPMLGSLTSVATAPEVSTVTFADLVAPPPSFVSGGQDRPPRTT